MTGLRSAQTVSDICISTLSWLERGRVDGPGNPTMATRQFQIWSAICQSHMRSPSLAKHPRRRQAHCHRADDEAARRRRL
jgi:hypothetical protein